MAEWNDMLVEQLRSLWAEGHSTAEIGRRIGFSKNAVVGKAHRLFLAARQSPIIFGPPTAPHHQRALQAPRVTLPPLASSAPIAPQPVVAPVAVVPEQLVVSSVKPASAMMVTKPVATIKPTPVVQPLVSSLKPAAPVPEPVATPVFRPRDRVVEEMTCCFPIGEPGRSDFRFCDKPVVPGRPYCRQCCQVAYVKVEHRSQREGIDLNAISNAIEASLRKWNRL